MIFFSKSDYRRFKGYLREAQEKYGHLPHAFVLMANHYHLLIETPKGNLAKVIHYVNASCNSSHRSFISPQKEPIVHHDLVLGMISKHPNDVPKGYLKRAL